MSNYPQGMTNEDWKHIDGEQHSRFCPEHEDFSHDCWPNTKNKVVPLFDAGRSWWALVVRTSLLHAEVPIDFCPYCGEDLGRPDCICASLREEMEERP